MSHITILCTYIIAGALLAGVRLWPIAGSRTPFDLAALLLASLGLIGHAALLVSRIFGDGQFDLSVQNMLSLITWEIALIAAAGAIVERFRGLAAILLVTAGLLAGFNVGAVSVAEPSTLGLPLKIHALTSLVAYSLITVGAVLASAALIQDHRLRAARPGGWIALLPPLVAMERLIFALAVCGFVGLLLSIATGLVFVENLFAQHLVHKTILTIIALVLFGALIGARVLAGWRGRAALFLYLGGFGVLVLAYFGSKIVLELVLGRQWG